MDSLCWRRFFVVVITTSIFLSCLPIHRSKLVEIDPGKDSDTVQVRFLGVGGFYIRKGDDAILTAPLYSNPKLPELLKKPIPPNVARIDRFHPKTATDVKAILVGHAHYDHLMDVPYVWQRTPDAIIYGNRSMKHLLAGYKRDPVQDTGIPDIPPGKVIALNKEGANQVDYSMCKANGAPEEDPDCPQKTGGAGGWVSVPKSKVRIRALCSQHPAQFLMFHLWTGCVSDPLKSVPQKADEYLEGETLAYLIDFMDADNRTPLYRIYYQDAATSPTIGQVPPKLLQEKAVDLALLCVGSFDTVTDPAHIVANTKPRAVILGHWENFFRPQDKRLKGIPFLDVKRLIRLVKARLPETTEVYLPAPQTLFHFRPARAGSAPTSQP